MAGKSRQQAGKRKRSVGQKWVAGKKRKAKIWVLKIVRRERKAWQEMKSMPTFQNWQKNKLPRAVAVGFLVQPPEQSLTAEKSARQLLESFMKKKKKSIFELAQIHYLKQVLKNLESIADFERWVSEQPAFKQMYKKWSQRPAIKKTIVEIDSKKFLEQDLPETLHNFQESRAAEGTKNFEGLLGEFHKCLTNMSMADAKSYASFSPKRELVREVLKDPKALKKLEKIFRRQGKVKDYLERDLPKALHEFFQLPETWALKRFSDIVKAYHTQMPPSLEKELVGEALKDEEEMKKLKEKFDKLLK